MKIEKTYLEVDSKKINTYLTVYFEGNKEEISMDSRDIYLCCGEEDTFEYWIKINKVEKDIFLKYLTNKEKLLNVIKSAGITLYKRYYEFYSKLVFIKDLEFDYLYKNERLVLPNEFAVLGYDFYSLYRMEESNLYETFRIATFSEYNQTIINRKSESSCTVNVSKVINYSSFHSLTTYSSNFGFKRVA